MRGGDIERRDRRRFAAISHEVPARRARASERAERRRREGEKRQGEEKIDRPADLADPSPGICKVAARHSVDPRFIGLCPPLILSLGVSNYLSVLFLLPPSPFLSTFRCRVGGHQARCTPGGDFCAAETAISARAKLNCRSRGGERMAADGRESASRQSRLASERERDGYKKRRENVLPHGGDSARCEIALCGSLELPGSSSCRRRSCANSRRLIDNGAIDHRCARLHPTMHHKHIDAMHSRRVVG